MADIVHRLTELHACYWLREWIRAGQFASMQAIWDACPRVTWMMWLLYNVGRERNNPRLVQLHVDLIQHCWKECTAHADVIQPWIEKALAQRAAREWGREFRIELRNAFVFPANDPYHWEKTVVIEAIGLLTGDVLTICDALRDGYTFDVQQADRREPSMADIVRKHFPTAPAI